LNVVVGSLNVRFGFGLVICALSGIVGVISVVSSG
jgi:hypothetical protein